MKKLTINKMNEYPTIDLDEQMMIKGGGAYGGIWPILEKIGEWLAAGVASVGISELWDKLTGEEKEVAKKHNYDINKLVGEALKQPSDSILVYPNGTVKIYGYGKK